MDRRLTARGRQRRQQLMEFAAHRFAENGYHPTSVAELVHGLGVGKGSFYWYFGSKSDLLVAILEDAQLALRRHQQQALVDEPDPLRRIERGIRASMQWLADHRHLYTLMQFAASDERFVGTVRRGQDVTSADTARHVKEGVVAGVIPDADPLVLTHAILGVTNHLARTFIFERGDAADAVADAAVAFCLGGLTGAAALEGPAYDGRGFGDEGPA